MKVVVNEQVTNYIRDRRVRVLRLNLQVRSRTRSTIRREIADFITALSYGDPTPELAMQYSSWLVSDNRVHAVGNWMELMYIIKIIVHMYWREKLQLN